MSNNIKYGSRILDMGVLLEMKALVNANASLPRPAGGLPGVWPTS